MLLIALIDVSAGDSMVYEPGIDLIVINYRSPIDLGHFLASYHKHEPDIPHTLIVGNVDPADEDLDVATKANVAQCAWGENIGYARAVNYLSTLGESEVLGIFNADTRLTENLVTECHNALMSNPTWAVVGPRQIDDTGRITHGGIFGDSAHPKERGFKHRNSNEYADIREDAITVSGSAYFIKRSVWNELYNCPIYRASNQDAEGAFLPTPHFYEETYCSFHARAHGYKTVYYGPATMIHRWHGSTRRTGPAERHLQQLRRTSREMFRTACDAHGIEHE